PRDRGADADLPLIEKPDDKWNPKQEDDVSLSWPSLCISITTKDDSGGLEVILDVYFPPHVASL
ncbi:hypothetical protein U9M48_040194, partial [Paspalum notatum var. saurae]